MRAILERLAAAPVVLPNTRTVQVRDYASCGDQLAVRLDRLACKGVGGFSAVAIARWAARRRENPNSKNKEAGRVDSPTVRRIVGPTMLLQSENYFDFMAPEDCTFTTEDIAHGLSNVCRFGGHCRHFYSFKQHSVQVAEILSPEHKLAGLLLDAAEALIGDVPKPLKDMLPHYQALKKRIEAIVAERFGLSAQFPAAVTDADAIARDRATPPHTRQRGSVLRRREASGGSHPPDPHPGGG